MRLWLLAYAVIVLAFGISLFFLSEHTDRYFAWTIDTPLTAVYLGAATLAAFPTALICAARTKWADGRSLLWGGSVAILTLDVATVIHLDLFHMDKLTGWLWVVLYAAAVPTLAAVLALQLRERGQDTPRHARLPRAVRLVLAADAIVLLAVGTTLFAFPADAESVWPWQLPPLASRAIGAWVLALGAFVLQILFEDDWRRVRPAMVYLACFGALELVGLLRYSGTPDWSAPRSWLYLGVLGTLLSIGLYGLLAQSRPEGQEGAVRAGLVG
jgi:hypothetical protein